MKIGIDKIGFYTPQTYMDMAELADARGVERGKYLVGLGQEEMAIAPLYEDAVTMAANAANAILDDADREQIDMILVGSESGIDNSKSIAVYVQSLAKLSSRVRAVELKQACYGATMGLQLARGHILDNPNSKVLVIATDIAKYGLNTPGEPTQGAGAIAMVISANPRLAVVEKDAVFHTEDVMDFWRPVYSDYAFADGKFSTEKYIGFFATVWEQYREKTGHTFADFSAMCFHQPFTKLGAKALQHVFASEQTPEKTQAELLRMYELSKTYNKKIGNIYTGSLYLSLISLLESATTLKAHDRIGLFSYGSGAVGEFFSVTLSENFSDVLYQKQHADLLSTRHRLTISEYEEMLQQTLPKDGNTYHIETYPTDRVVLTGIDQHQRLYKTI